MRLLALIGKELRIFFRDPALVFVVVFVFLIHPYQSATQFSSSVNQYPVAVYDLDRTPASADLIDRLRPPYFALQARVQRDREISELLDRGAISMVVVVPEGFARRIYRGEIPQVQVISDGTYSTTARLAAAYVTEIAQQFARDRSSRSTHHAGLPIVEAQVRMRYNPTLQSDWPQALDMLFMGIGLISLLLPAAFMVREKEQGTIEQLLVSPLRPWEITAAKILPMILVTTSATLASLGILAWTLDLPIRGSLVLFLAATALTVFSMSGISLLIATFTRTLPSALILAFMLMIPIQYLSGSVTPVEAMPAVQNYLTLLSPQRYYLNIAYGVLLKGASLATLWKDFLGLTLVGSGLFVLGARRFQRQFE